ncbi:MAG: ABC transporter ATP-binding protein [Micrococcales bacterium]|nr:ABC transporter ATP-binding protein [Micrococcales bacterium]NBR54635.1 ABC transporter ATP-binding protein [Micrococcales bacterium]NBR60988.1 ABC transporter ATP-binding protein [Actinomycetota bacterium]NBT46589.1 ABC transporter ATP-binding protein [Actinomycetota bacterium]NBY43607.1 ABC transporter ATP-binding protein [Micrococcales bacterium]
MVKEFVARGADLELKSIRKEFPGFVAIENLDLVVPAGEFFALLGPSGCGKTTTLRLVAGLETPTKGKILIGKKDVTETKPHERPVNTVFQSYALFPHMTVLENVAFGLKQRKIQDPLAKAKEALNLVQLAHLAERKPQQLSGGQQQRVALARALVNRPSLLLLDEPLGALDLKLRREMQIELKAIQMEVGLTFLHVTHDQEEAMDMADTVAVMNQGRIEQMGAPEALYDRPKTVFVSKFLGQSNLFVGDVTEKSGNSISIDVAGNKISVPKDRAEKHSGKIAIGFRPEKATFHVKKPTASADKNVIGPGEIIDIRFTGVSNQYLIEIPELGEITVFAQNMGQSPVIELGEKVWVSWSVDHSFGLSDLPNGMVEA